jgi:hypothetical protein
MSTDLRWRCRKLAGSSIEIGVQTRILTGFGFVFANVSRETFAGGRDCSVQLQSRGTAIDNDASMP